MIKKDIGKKVDQIGERVIEINLVRNFIDRVYQNKLFKFVYSKLEKLKARKMLQEIKQNPIPRHLAIIMDGNRRFARELGLDPCQGHQFGRDKLEEVVEWCLNDVGIEDLTVYAFSTENLCRSKGEVKVLMNLFERNLRELAKNEKIHKNRVKVRIIGQLSLLPDEVREAAELAMESTKDYGDHSFNIAIAYGGREEIIQAMKRITSDVSRGQMRIDDINEDSVSSYLYTSDLPDPDLILRTSGEERISNFLLWQLAYSELYFADVYWPAFKKIDLLKAIKSYQERKRRYGK
jgi:tritrans,polycis-undecaprenyl-diphosphate synthase [geranylgeranyl-diphosphate specific]